MNRLYRWLSAVRFKHDMRYLIRRANTPEGALHWLEAMLQYLKKVSFKEPLTSIERNYPINTYAYTCDNLLLDLQTAIDIIRKDGDYVHFMYHKRQRRTVSLDAYLVTNNREDIPVSLLVNKLAPAIKELLELHFSNIGEETATADHHLRNTARMVDEINRLMVLLLSVSDQKLLIPSSANNH